MRFLDVSTARDPSVQSSSLSRSRHLPPPTGLGCSSLMGGGERESNVLCERSLLFNFARKRSAVSGGESNKKRKKQVSLWRHKFVCLSETDQDKTPTAYERALLIAAGICCSLYMVYCIVPTKMVNTSISAAWGCNMNFTKKNLGLFFPLHNLVQHTKRDGCWLCSFFRFGNKEIVALAT